MKRSKWIKACFMSTPKPQPAPQPPPPPEEPPVSPALNTDTAAETSALTGQRAKRTGYASLNIPLVNPTAGTPGINNPGG